MIDRDVLAEFFPKTVVSSVERGPVGNGQETWFVGTADGDVVVRRTAEAGPLDWTDREREFRVLQTVATAGLPTPEPLWFEPAGGRLERAAFAMTRLPGGPLRREPQEVKDRIAAQLGTLLGRLHRSGSDHGESAADATRRELGSWRAQYLERRRGSIPMLGALLAWLDARVPESRRAATLLWGDAGPHNILHVDGAITGLLDWELAHVGDPLEDLGGALWALHGVANPERTIGAYEAETATAVDREALRWFTVFASVNRGIMVIYGIANYLDGTSRGQNHAGIGLHLLPTTLRRAAGEAGWGPGPAAVEAPKPEPSGDDMRPRPDAAEALRGVAAFLASDVLPVLETPVLRRNLKTAVALVETAALRTLVEAAVFERRHGSTTALLDTLAATGVDTSGGLEATAARIEAEESLAEHREPVRAHLMADLARQEGLLLPLRRLYGTA